MRYTRRIRRGETIAPAAHRQWRHARRSAHVSVPAGGRLAIFVEHMGHINYGPLLVDDRKGIVEPVALGGGRLTGWDMFRLPFDAPSAVTPDSIDAGGRPTVYRGSFTIDSTGDTFLDTRGWNRGIVFVKGVNLGRYWRVGPQQTLYLPGAWLHRGRNEVEVFDLEDTSRARALPVSPRRFWTSFGSEGPR